MNIGERTSPKMETNDNPMKVSIITTCKNRVWNIREAMESVLHQRYRDIEYIVIDGASTDGTQQVIESVINSPLAAGRTIKYVSEPDRGMYDALNKGVRMATGDVIGMLHSDDYMQDEWVVSEYVKKFEETGADLVYADAFLVDREIPDKILRRLISGPYSEQKFRFGWTPVHSTCMVKRERCIEVGPYNQEYQIAADTDWMIRYMRYPAMKVEYLGLRFVQSLRQGGVCTDLRHSANLWKEDLLVYHAHGLWPVGFPKLMKVWRKVPQIFSARLRRVYWGMFSFVTMMQIARTFFKWKDMLLLTAISAGVGYWVYVTNWHRPLLSLTWACGVFVFLFSWLLLYKVLWEMVEIKSKR